MKKYIAWVVFGSVIYGCSTSHKLTGTNYVDLANGGQMQVDENFPTEIAGALGWGDLASDTLENVVEEFRFSFTSEFEPHHLIRVSKERNVTGSMVLYWRKKENINLLEPYKNMKQYLKGRCSAIYTTERYEYCIPNFKVEPNWGQVYSRLETRGIWVRPDQTDLALESLPDSNIWVMNTQVRLGDYFRTYTHTSPEQYAGLNGESNLLGIISELQTISNIQESPDNFNSYVGITSGKVGSKFFLCSETDTWRFNAEMEDLVNRSGLPNKIDYSTDGLFYVTISGTVQSVWYTNRNNNGYEKEITPSEIHSIRVVSKRECPK